jgi:hypothetical protein
MSALMELAERVQDTPIGTAIVESRYAFPIIEGVHLIGLSLSVGLILLIDLRLLGLTLREVSIANALKHLRPYILSGFLLVFVSGALLSWAEAAEVLKSPATPYKFAFMFLAGINAAYFEFVTVPRNLQGPASRRLPVSARFAGGASIGLWVLVITFGRLIAYLPN